MTMTMAGHLLLLMPVIVVSLPDTSASSSLQIQSQNQCLHDNNSLICQLHDLKFKLAYSESILEESVQNSNAKSIFLRECEKLVAEMAHKICHLRLTLCSIKDDSVRTNERLAALELEVHLLWVASTENNFDLHVWKYEAENAEDRSKEVTSKVETFINHVYEVHVKKLKAILEPARNSAIRSYISAFHIT